MAKKTQDVTVPDLDHQEINTSRLAFDQAALREDMREEQGNGIRVVDVRNGEPMQWDEHLALFGTPSACRDEDCPICQGRIKQFKREVAEAIAQEIEKSGDNSAENIRRVLSEPAFACMDVDSSYHYSGCPASDGSECQECEVCADEHELRQFMHEAQCAEADGIEPAPCCKGHK